MTLSVAATQKLVQALRYIHEHPEEWDQGDWIHFVDSKGAERYGTTSVTAAASCGTAACVAGRIALQDPGYRPWVDDGFVYPSRTVDSTGNVVHVSFFAAYLLIEDSTDRKRDNILIDELFSASNNEADLWTIAQELSPYPLQAPDGVL
jgi:hypothetical protein